jgi:hypothetical protein
MDRIENDVSNKSSLPQERLSEMLPSNDRGLHRQTHRLSFDKTRTAYKMRRANNLVLCVFIAAGTCLPSCCLAMIGGITFTLTDRRDI